MIPLPHCLKKLLLGSLLVYLGGFFFVCWWESQLYLLPDHDYLPEIEQKIEDGAYGEALAIAETVVEAKGMPNEERIAELIPEIRQAKESKARMAKDAVKGFITGNADSGSALAGNVAGDLFFWGDIRDLAKEGYHWARGEEVDELVAALSTLGLASSAATFFPEPGTTVAGVTTQTGFTALKVLRKVGALTQSFTRQMIHAATACKKTKSLAPISGHLKALGSLVRRSPDGAVATIMREVESTRDLQKVAECMQVDSNRTFTLIHTGGKSAVKSLSTGGRPHQSWAQVAIRKGAENFVKVRWFSRFAKFFQTGGLNEIKHVVVDLLTQSHLLRLLFVPLSLLFISAGAYLLYPCKVVLRVRRFYRNHFDTNGVSGAAKIV